MKRTTADIVFVKLPADDWQRVLFLLDISLRYLAQRTVTITEKSFNFVDLNTHAIILRKTGELLNELRTQLEGRAKMASWSSMNFIAAQAPTEPKTAR